MSTKSRQRIFGSSIKAAAGPAKEARKAVDRLRTRSLYNVVGNVWEWTQEPFRIASLKREARARQQQMNGYKLSKGGSFLCHASYCYRYRIAARTGSSPDSTTSHQGFRVVWDE
jgi:formylglycine-generating enzyme required for sulfatase activity